MDENAVQHDTLGKYVWLKIQKYVIQHIKVYKDHIYISQFMLYLIY